MKLALQPLVDLAQRTGCTVLGNGHFGKDKSGGAVRSAQGSNAFTNTPRVALAMAHDDADVDVRVVEVVKSNVGSKGVGRNYRIRLVAVAGLEEPVPVLVAEGAAAKSVDDLLVTQTRGKRVSAELLRALVLRELGQGEQSRQHLDEVASRETGANSDSVYKSALSPLKNEGLIKARKDGLGGGWFWHLSTSGLIG